MQEVCYCGRTGEIEERKPVRGGGELALRCPDCGHPDHMGWLPEDARRLVLGEAERRRLSAA